MCKLMNSILNPLELTNPPEPVNQLYKDVTVCSQLYTGDDDYYKAVTVCSQLYTGDDYYKDVSKAEVNGLLSL